MEHVAQTELGIRKSQYHNHVLQLPVFGFRFHLSQKDIRIFCVSLCGIGIIVPSVIIHMKFMSTLFVCFPRYLFREKVSWLIDCARIK